jgi:hypothetical protein
MKQNKQIRQITTTARNPNLPTCEITLNDAAQEYMVWYNNSKAAIVPWWGMVRMPQQMQG